jgi:hypothetical protein
MPMDPSSLLAGGPPQGAGAPQGSGGQRPALTSITMNGIDRQGGEQITLTFADGFKATETFPELVQMGLEAKIIESVGQVFEHVGDLVYKTNRGGGAPPMGGSMMGGGMPPGMMGR